jgi:hypothetical protein
VRIREEEKLKCSVRAVDKLLEDLSEVYEIESIGEFFRFFFYLPDNDTLERHTHSISSDAAMMQSYIRSEIHQTGVICRFMLIVNLDTRIEGTRRVERSGLPKRYYSHGEVSEASKEENAEGISQCTASVLE